MKKSLPFIRWIIFIALVIIMAIEITRGQDQNAILAGVLALINKPGDQQLLPIELQRN